MSPKVVTAHDVTVAYGSKVALARSSFHVPTGSVTALIGPNGSGKSTVLNLIAGLVRPVEGEVTVGGGDGPRPRIAYVLQSTKVNESLPVTVREVVTMARYPGKGLLRPLGADDRQAVSDALETMGVTDLAGSHLGELSGGQRQRVLVAQGLAQEHDLLLLDEPLTGLDMPSAERIDRIIHDEQERGRTVVLTTHDLAEAGAADHVLLLAGRVVAEGPPEQALTAEHLAEAYGAGLLHAEAGEVRIDDPAHRPVEGRHLHRERTIHVESPESDIHD